jgi:hypothetical protein
MHKNQSSKRNRFKLIPEVDKALKILAAELTPIPKIIISNGKAEVHRRKVSQLVSGASVIEQGTNEVNGEAVRSDKNYVNKTTEPLMMNHYLNLIEQYQKLGDQGVANYKAYINQLALRMGLKEAVKKEQVIDEAEIVHSNEEQKELDALSAQNTVEMSHLHDKREEEIGDLPKNLQEETSPTVTDTES